MPFDDPTQRCSQWQDRTPPLQGASLGRIEPQQACFMRYGPGPGLRRLGFAPQRLQLGNDPGYGTRIAIGWPEVPSIGKFALVSKQPFGDQQVTMRRLQQMLPGSNRGGRTNCRRLAPLEGTDQVREQPVKRPVAAANDIARAHRRQRHAALANGPDRKERPAIGRKNLFGTALRTGIGVLSPHRIALTTGPDPFAVLVTLGDGYAHEGLNGANEVSGLQQMERLWRRRVSPGFRPHEPRSTEAGIELSTLGQTGTR